MSHKTEWDKRYSNDGYIYGINPNEFFAQSLSALPKGTLLLPGEGEGRNALWAAKQGWRVTAVDYSRVAQTKALQLCGKHNVEVNYIVSELASFTTEEQFDVIAFIYVHIAKQEQAKIATNAIAMLKPGGHIIMEIFHPDQIGRSSGGPKDPNLFVSTDELRANFGSLDILNLEKVEINLNEGTHHNGNAIVIRMLAQKPAKL